MNEMQKLKQRILDLCASEVADIAVENAPPNLRILVIMMSEDEDIHVSSAARRMDPHMQRKLLQLVLNAAPVLDNLEMENGRITHTVISEDGKTFTTEPNGG